MEEWQLAAIIGTSLVTVIGILWKMIITHWNKTELRLEKEEEKREELGDKLIALTSKVSKLEGIETMTNRVMDEIRADRLEAYERGKRDNR